MSRYTKHIRGEDGSHCDLSWGFDSTLGYWYDIFERKYGIFLSREKQYDSILLEEKSSVGGSHGICDRGDFIEVLVKYGCPKEHRKMVALDYPF
jgi:hypothetical protein